MTNTLWYSTFRKVLVLTGATALLFTSGCGNQAQLPAVTATGNATVNKDGLPLRGMIQETTPPAKAVIGMIYRNTSEERDYIYDGRQWVPHDATADDFYKSARSKKVAAVVTSLTSLNGGAHDQHAANGCEDCHRVDWANGLGLVWFDNTNSPAFGAGMAALSTMQQA